MTSHFLTLCPCCSGLNYCNCCEPFHLGLALPHTPEQLMRARYCAYALKNTQYVFNTYIKDKQADNPIAEIDDFANGCRFIKLTILESNYDHDNGFVKFRANYFYNDLFCELIEHSQFTLEDKQWRYAQGEITPVAEIKIGRNDTCPCGSNKKYKKCHSI